MKVTLSVIKADIGGYVGHSDSHRKSGADAEKMEAAKNKGLLIDYHVTKCGDDGQLIMTTRKARATRKYTSSPGIPLSTAPSWLRSSSSTGRGRTCCPTPFPATSRGWVGGSEMEIEERKSEPVLIFMADKTSAGAWNLPLYKMFAEPFNTIGLVIAPNMHKGFSFESTMSRSTRKSASTAPKRFTICWSSSAPPRATPSRLFTAAIPER
jgi:fructose 1,6-bisphosphate aldolase/phosphatase